MLPDPNALRSHFCLISHRHSRTRGTHHLIHLPRVPFVDLICRNKGQERSPLGKPMLLGCSVRSHGCKHNQTPNRITNAIKLLWLLLHTCSRCPVTVVSVPASVLTLLHAHLPFLVLTACPEHHFIPSCRVLLPSVTQGLLWPEHQSRLRFSLCLSRQIPAIRVFLKPF